MHFVLIIICIKLSTMHILHLELNVKSTYFHRYFNGHKMRCPGKLLYAQIRLPHGGSKNNSRCSCTCFLFQDFACRNCCLAVLFILYVMIRYYQILCFSNAKPISWDKYTDISPNDNMDMKSSNDWNEIIVNVDFELQPKLLQVLYMLCTNLQRIWSQTFVTWVSDFSFN